MNPLEWVDDPLVWVAVGLVLYWLAVLAVRRRSLFPGYVGTQGPILTIHTRRGKRFLDWLARPKRLWRAWGNFGIGIALVFMVGTFVVLVQSAIQALRNPPAQTVVNQPRNVLVIPGVNDFLPLSVAPEILFGLLVGLVVHEGGHGLLCRVEEIDIESMGVALLAILPIGAFVEPDDESRRRANRGAQTRMFAAGVTNNFAVTILAFALLFGPVMGSIQVAPGAAVGGALEGSPAAQAGIDGGDRIVAVGGQPVADGEQLDALLANTTAGSIPVELASGETATVERAVYVTGTVVGSPAARDVSTGDTIVAVNGTSVSTEAGFREALANRTVATLTVQNTSGASSNPDTFETTIPIGVHLAEVRDGGPTAAAGVPTDAEVVVTHVAGERVVSHEDLNDVMTGTEPGQTIELRAVVDGTPRSYEVTLGRHPSANYGFLGISSTFGTSGMVVDDFGTRSYPAGLYASLIDGDRGCVGCPPGLDNLQSTFFGRIALSLLLPLAGLLGLPFNFAGFTGGVANYYVVEGGPLSFVGDPLFVVANALFWTGWINVNLGFFNCIPAFPLDGGHILRTSTEAVVSRLPVSEPRQVTTTVTTTVGLLMLVSLILMVFGPQLLSG